MSIWRLCCLVAGLPLASSAVAEPASSALTPYGDASSAAEWGQYDCLTSGVAVSGFSEAELAEISSTTMSVLLRHTAPGAIHGGRSAWRAIDSATTTTSDSCSDRETRLEVSSDPLVRLSWSSSDDDGEQDARIKFTLEFELTGQWRIVAYILSHAHTVARTQVIAVLLRSHSAHPTAR